MENQQLYPLSNDTIQVIVSGILGDNSINTQSKNKLIATYSLMSSCIHKEYLDYKASKLSLFKPRFGFIDKNGYCNKPIHTLRTLVHPFLNKYAHYSLADICKDIDEKGLALWFYDDCSLHKRKLFYNISTHSFSKEEQEKYLIPLLNSYNIFPKLTIERKKDGREFYYLRVSKFEGAYEMTTIMGKLPFKCFEYKRWSSETILLWSKLQVELKRLGVVASNKRMSVLLTTLEKGGTIQDIVQSLEKSKAGLTAVC